MFPYIDNFLRKTSSRGMSHHAISLLFYLLILIYHLLWCSSLILLSRDSKTNPSPISCSGQCLSICHGNLNSTAAHNYAKLYLCLQSSS